MAVSQWKLARVEVAEKSLLQQEFSAKIQIPMVDKLWQCQHRLERSYARAQRELERLQNSRRHPVPQPVKPAPAPHPEPEPPPASPSPPPPHPTRNPPYVISPPPPP